MFTSKSEAACVLRELLIVAAVRGTGIETLPTMEMERRAAADDAALQNAAFGRQNSARQVANELQRCLQDCDGDSSAASAFASFGPGVSKPSLKAA